MNNQIQQRIDRLKSYGQSLAGANVAIVRIGGRFILV